MPFKKILLSGLIFCLLVAGGLALLVSNLDVLASRVIREKYGALLEEKRIRFCIDKIGFSRAVISGLRFGNSTLAHRVELEYGLHPSTSVGGLIEAKKVRISGLSIDLSLDDSGQPVLEGIELPGAGTVQGKKSPSRDITALIRKVSHLVPEEILVQNSKVALTLGKTRIEIPFELEAVPDRKALSAQIKAGLTLWGSRVDIKSDLDLNRAGPAGTNLSGLIQQFTMEARHLALDHINPLLQGLPGFTGRADIRLEKRGDFSWKFSLSGLDFVRPRGLGLQDLTADVKIKDQVASIGTAFQLVCSQINGVVLKRPGSDSAQDPAVPVSGKIRLSLKEPDPAFELDFETRPFKGVAASQESLKMAVENPFFFLVLKGGRDKAFGRLGFKSKRVSAVLDQNRISAPESKIDARIRAGIKGNSQGASTGAAWIDLDFDSKLFGPAFNSPKAEFEGKALEVRGSLSGRSGRPPAIKATGELINARFVLPESELTFSGIHALLPFGTGNRAGYKKGRFRVAAAQWKKWPAIRLWGDLVQKGPLGIKIMGSAGLQGVDDLNLTFSGAADPDKRVAHADFFIDRFLLESDQLKKRLPELDLVPDFGLDLSLNAGFAYNNNSGLTTRAKLEIHDGFAALPDMHFKASGIRTLVAFKDLIRPESLPGQILTVNFMESGKVKLDNARIRFSIEDGEFVHIENGRAEWCKGLLSTESLRFPSKGGRHTLIVYCDRLEMAGLLEQMGAFEAKGEGTLSGRIPVTYSKGDISFDRGFLFSTPGTGGRVRIENTDRLTAGIPVDTLEFSQLDLAKEALRDFHYEWAKLELNSVADTLEVKMELDGKPARVLPFEYKKEIGSFVRVEGESLGSRFQGIKLDVNLKLPFNRVMKFGNNLKSLLGQ